MTRALAVLAVPIVILILHDLVRRPTIRRIALRNVVRRKGEAVLVVLGSLLGTAIITASFIVGDTLGASIRDFARTELGPIDIEARVAGLEQFPALTQALATPPPGSDGVLPMVTTNAAVATVGGDRRAEPNANLIEIDFARARAFGGRPADTGLADAGSTPAQGEAVVVETLADTMDIGAGDEVEVFAYGRSVKVRVRKSLEKVGLAGYREPAIFVAPGTIAGLASGGSSGASPPDGLVLVSNNGGVFDAVEGSDAVEREVEARVAGLGAVDVAANKRDLLDDADAAGKEFTELFGGIGAFSVIAGILLLVNIFVMLAEERKSELGMLRAVGLKRNHLVRAFGMEGGVYSVVAAALGALAGVGVGRVIVVAAQSIFNQGDSDFFRISLRFQASPSSVVGGAVFGGVIALFTVWLSSGRLARLNVIRAIRDIPEPVLRQQRMRTVIAGAAFMVIGGLLFASGIAGKQWFGTMAGLPIAAFAAIPLLTRVIPRRWAVTLPSAIALAWPIACFSVTPDVFEEVDIPAFVVQGFLLVAAAVILGTANADLVGGSIERVTGSMRTLAAKLGVAYPLARRFRTAMLLAMFGIVIFVITFLTVFSNLLAKQAPRMSREMSAGFDVIADSNPANPVPLDQLTAQPEVADAAPLLRGGPRWTSRTQADPMQWPFSGFDGRFISRGVPKLSVRDPQFASDRAVWEAVRGSSDLIIVSDFFLQDEGGPPQGTLKVGDVVTMHHPVTGETRSLRVVGKQESDWVFNGAFVGADFARSFLGPLAVPSRTYVAVKPGVTPELASVRLTGRLLENGVDAESIDKTVREGLEQNEGFFRLMQGYLTLGLLIGIAGLGVVMIRAVRERRREIGMLRAMGFQAATVRRAFLLEAAFVAVQGIAIGAVLAIIVSYQLLSNSDAFGDQQLPFEVPWAGLAILLLVTLVASLVATFAPAQQASRIKPAVALRIAD